MFNKNRGLISFIFQSFFKVFWRLDSRTSSSSIGPSENMSSDVQKSSTKLFRTCSETGGVYRGGFLWSPSACWWKQKHFVTYPIPPCRLLRFTVKVSSLILLRRYQISTGHSSSRNSRPTESSSPPIPLPEEIDLHPQSWYSQIIMGFLNTTVLLQEKSEESGCFQTFLYLKEKKKLKLKSPTQ